MPSNIFTSQGTLSTTGTKLYEARGDSAVVTRLMITNIDGTSCNITVKRYDYKTRTLTQIFQYNLLSGYVYEDTGPYLMNARDYFIASSDQPNTTFLIQGNDLYI